MNELELRMNPKQYVYPDTYTCTYIHIYTYTLFWICLSSKYLCHLCLWRSSIQDRSQKTPIDSKTLWVCWEGAQVGWTSESPNQHLLNDTCSKMFEKHEYIQHEYAGCLWSLLHTESANAQQIIAMQRSCCITYGHHSLVLQCYILPQHSLHSHLPFRTLDEVAHWQVWDGLGMYGYVWMVGAQFEGSRATICPPANLHQFPPLHRRVALFDLWALRTIRAWNKMKQPTAVRDRGRCWQKLMETDEI